tara:strand:- start:289 stop:906 length:618 start_codon:yes stop_codon:yes gene_type:complete
MKLLLSISPLIALLLSITSSEAQIGEPRKNVHRLLGQPVGSIEPRLVESVGKAELFKNGGIEVIVEYDQNEKAWVIIYHGRNVKTRTAESLVAENLGPNVQQTRFLNTEYWIEREEKLRAFYYRYPSPKCVVMTLESLDSERKPRQNILKALPNVLPPKVGSKGSRPVGLSGTKNDPISAFRFRNKESEEDDSDSSSKEVDKEKE